MKLIDNGVLYRVKIKKEIWELQFTDVEEFKRQVRDYLKKGYRNYKPVEARDGFIFCERID
ncbi:hypothetical protein LC040_12280 [Bacillus tianshenii]|nr:hypothetical protein LC040_12280 [Bacillus tianshenii]